MGRHPLVPAPVSWEASFRRASRFLGRSAAFQLLVVPAALLFLLLLCPLRPRPRSADLFSCSSDGFKSTGIRQECLRK